MLRLVVMARRRSHILRLATCAVVVVATAACGWDSRPTTPSPQPQIPNVAGTYRGPLTITASTDDGLVMSQFGLRKREAQSGINPRAFFRSKGN